RMAGNVQPPAVDAELLGVQPQPAAGAQHLPHDLVDRHLRAEVVVHHRDGDAGLDPRRREEREVLLVERAPVAAVDEHHARAVAAARRKEVDRLPRHVAIAAVELAVERGTGARRGIRPAREVLRVVGHQRPVVVLRFEARLVEDHAHARCSRHSPIASWPGRSENENSTVSSFASSSSGTHEGTTKASRGPNSKDSPPALARPRPSTTEYTAPSMERYGLVLEPFGSSWMKAAIVGMAWLPV